MASTGVTGGYQRRRFAGVTFASAPLPPVAGYVAWYDASRITGVADGASLTAWADGSATGANLAGTATYYKTTAGKLVNGLPAVWFNGTSNQMLNASAPNMSRPVTLFSVQLAAALGGNMAIVSDDGGGFNFQAMQAGPVYTNPGGSGGVPDTTNPHIVEGAIPSGANADLTVDGTQLATHVANPVTVAGIVVGSLGGTWWFNGAICEVLVYPSVLSAGDRTSVRGYLKTKWGTP